jgi:hypothetical protein
MPPVAQLPTFAPLVLARGVIASGGPDRRCGGGAAAGTARRLMDGGGVPEFKR